VRFLQNIFCVGPGPEHPIGNSEEPWTVSVEYISRRSDGLSNRVGFIPHTLKTVDNGHFSQPAVF
jgi:hypothetical protein